MSGVYKKVWDNNINVNPDNIQEVNDDTINTIIDRVRNENFVRIGDYTLLKFTLISGRNCDIILLEKTFHFSSFAFPVSKDFFHYIEHFNQR